MKQNKVLIPATYITGIKLTNEIGHIITYMGTRPTYINVDEARCNYCKSTISNKIKKCDSCGAPL